MTAFKLSSRSIWWWIYNERIQVFSDTIAQHPSTSEMDLTPPLTHKHHHYPCQQHSQQNQHPNMLPSKNCFGPMLHNFSYQIGTGVFNIARPLAKLPKNVATTRWCSHKTQNQPQPIVYYFFSTSLPLASPKWV